MLKYTEKLNEQAKLEKLNDKVKLEDSKARFDKWKDSSKNLDKLIHSSMSSRSKFGLGFRETFRLDEVFDLSAPNIFDTTPEDVTEKPIYDRFVKVVGMHVVPPPITGTFMPPSNNSDIDDTYDKSSDSETTGFASCVSSVKSSSSKTNEHLASASSLVDFKIVSKTADQKPSSTIDDPSFSFKENVKTPRNICNKSGINNRSHCKNNSFSSKTCFVCGSKIHLIKDCDFYEQQLGLYNKPMWHNVANIPSCVPRSAYVPASSRNPPDNPHKNKDLGIVDSGCSRSMTGNKENLDDFVKIIGVVQEFLLRKRQQDVLDSAKYYTDADWTDIMGQVHANQRLTYDLLGLDVNEDNFAERMVALIAERRRAFAAQRFQEKRNKPMTYAQQKAYIRTFFEKIRTAVADLKSQKIRRTLKRAGKDLEHDVSKKPKPIEVPMSSQPDVPQQQATNVPPVDPQQPSEKKGHTYGTRRKSLGTRKKSSTALDLDADDRSFTRVLSDDDSDDDDDPVIFWSTFA
ncbi:hypothetical protein Tco_1446107, partial [Tanacetum coccineum]